MARIASVAILGSLLAACLDVVAGLVLPGPAFPSPGSPLLVASLILGRAGLLGLTITLGVLVLYQVPQRLAGVRRPSGAPSDAVLRCSDAAGAALVFAAFEVLNWRLFQGAAISQKSWADEAEWAFRLIGGAAAFTLGYFGRHLFRWLQEIPALLKRIAVATGLLALLLLVLVLNATVLRSQYPTLHLQLAGVAALLGALFVATALPPSLTSNRRVSAWLGACCAILAFVCVGAALFARADSAFMRHVPYLSRFRALEDFGRLFEFISSHDASGLRKPDADQSRIQALRARLSERPVRDSALEKLLRERAASGRRLNVLWIAIDTVRADHVSSYGYKRRTTPNLDALASDGALFLNAWTAYPTSNYAYSSLLTSLPPRATPAFAAVSMLPWKFPDGQALPAMLGRTGYHSLGLTAFDARTASAREWFGTLRDGFSEYNPDQQEDGYDAVELTERATAFLKKQHNAPWLLWVHYLDPHEPYVRHPDFDFGPELIDRYDSDIAYTDSKVGVILEALRESGQWEDTIIAIFSDHGEEFLERGGRFHNSSVYEEQIRVPLVVRVPSAAPVRISSAVSLMDLVPTMMHALALKDDAPRFGRSLLPHLSGEEDADGGLAYAEWFENDGRRISKESVALRRGRRKSIYSLPRRGHEFYDLVEDPEERRSLVGLNRPEESESLEWTLAFRQWAEGHHRGIEKPSSAGNLRARLDATLDEIFRAKEVQAGSLRELKELFLDRYGRISATVRADLGTQGLERVFNRLEALVEDASIQNRRPILEVMTQVRDPARRAFFERIVGRDDVDQYLCARALALIGEPAMKDVLASQLDRLPAFDPDAINALAFVGDARSLPWLWVNCNVMAAGRRHADALLALPKLREVLGSPARWIRDRFTYQETRHSEVSHVLVDVLAGESDPDATVLLLRLARDQDADVRQRALDALRARTSPEALEYWLHAIDLEMAGDGAALYAGPQMKDALEHYSRAKTLGPVPNRGLDFRIALVELGLGNPDKAFSVLTPIRTDPEAPILDRWLASRFIDLGPIFPDLEGLKMEFPEPLKFQKVAPLQRLVLRTQAKNLGRTGWRGGWARPNFRFRLSWLDESGAPVSSRDQSEDLSPLAETGALPMETIEVLILGLAPDRPGRFRPILTVHSTWGPTPDDGIVYRHPELISVEQP